jgi:hypothetical protein
MVQGNGKEVLRITRAWPARFSATASMRGLGWEMTYLTQEEINLLQLSGLSRETPYLITGVSHGYFSVARHYGGCIVSGKHYVYIPATDELIRDDVMKWVIKLRKKAKKPKEEQPKLL